ncbi:MAG: 2-oxoacid:acceptor oxidoreductase family protein [Spirochaetes bacterium]|nr:2-oxoacid:acceptor oxidoreductase family protein [Spirochaetota bacterium]
MEAKVKHVKPAVFYEEFFRKGTGQRNTHYCPGCGHGTAHKLVAEAVTDLGVQDRVVFCSSVGCSVFAYYYFDCCNIQCAHGRAPAVATGIRRVLRDAIIISYQGDGDLAAIGTGAIVHAANRGENITVFFVNNAIYGMTGGQMAPTTLVGQSTKTTPMKRSVESEGYPIGMAELLSSLKAPVFIERVSLGDIKRIFKARRVIRKAIENQVAGRGFSFVEILSPCPVNWKMGADNARRWLLENMEPVFPVQNFRDRADDSRPGRGNKVKEVSDEEYYDLFHIEEESSSCVMQTKHTVGTQSVKIAGFGGQGVLSAGVILAKAALYKGLNSTWLPSYGPEMRGGTANVGVIISSSKIGAPVVDRPDMLIAMNGPSLDAFEESVVKGGLIFVNKSLIKRKVAREDVRTVYVPATDIAKELGLVAAANVVILSIYALCSNVIDIDTLRKIIPEAIKKRNLISINLKAVEAGVSYYDKTRCEV